MFLSLSQNFCLMQNNYRVILSNKYRFCFNTKIGNFSIIFFKNYKVILFIYLMKTSAHTPKTMPHFCHHYFSI